MAQWPDLATLELLVRVAELGSVGAAAERLGMTQPAASRALARFERRCGLTLLERSPRGSRLTAHGSLMVDWSREVLAAAERMSFSAAALRRERTAQLRIAASMTVAEYLVPAWLAAFRRAHPAVDLDLAVLNSDDVVAGVADGRHDLGLVETTRLPSRVHSMVIGRDELWVVVPPQHPWARRSRRLTLAELARTPLALREPGSGTRRVLEDALAEHGLTAADPAAELSSNAAVRIAAAAGAGPAVLSEHAVRSSVAGGDLVAVPLVEGPLQRELRAVWIGGAHPVGPAGDLVTTILR